MDLTETIKTTPIVAEQSVRRDEVTNLTSCRAGKVIPIAAIPLLREDRVARGRLQIEIDMAETVLPLMNAVNVTCYAHFVPFSAFERFNGSMDTFNKSYMGEPVKPGDDVVPFFVGHNYESSNEIYHHLGFHAPEGGEINSAYNEAYNVLLNWRRAARSEKLPQRTNMLSPWLGYCNWKNSNFRHIVPDFDQAIIDGEVELNLVGKAPVKGIGGEGSTSYALRDAHITGGEIVNGRFSAPASTSRSPMMAEDPDNPGFPGIFAELNQANVKLSLANIEVAKQTSAFAQMRKQYSGLDDDALIDLLMQAVRIPDIQMTQPILLDKQSTIFGYAQRYATDSGNLDKSVTSGMAKLNMNVRTPPMNPGGVILVTAEIVPELIYERCSDPLMGTLSPENLPSFTRDFLDAEKVDIVQNKFVDVLHTDDDSTFGYAPLNHEWNRTAPRVGGKFKRRVGDPFVEDRQRIWSIEQIDPTLQDNFYLAQGINHGVFADTNADPFEITTLGSFDIIGNTVFGKGLQENSDDYQIISDSVDDGRIDQDANPVPAASED